MFLVSEVKLLFFMPLPPKSWVHTAFNMSVIFPYYSIIQYIQTAASHLSRPPSPPYTPSLSPRSTHPPFLFRKRAGLLVTSRKYGLTRCNKTGHKPSYQGWTKQRSEGKGPQRQAKDSETAPLPTVRNPTRTLSYTAITFM